MRTWLTVIGIGLLMAVTLALIAGSVAAGPPVQSPDSTTAVLAGPVASKISYQGRLTDAGGNPLNGNYNLVFQLWDDASAGSQVGSDIVKNNVPVNQGLFTTDLDVQHLDFNGQALWLRIQVNGQWLSPRQELLPTPYALSLRPGAQIGANNSASALVVGNLGTGTAISASSSQGWGLDVYSGEDVALYASAGTIPLILITGKQAVVAYGEDNGVIAWGGQTGGSFEGSTGVKGTGGTRGVHGLTDSDAEGAAGVYGESTNMLADGVRGQGAHGVHGLGFTGVFGEGDVGVSGNGIVGVSGESGSNGGSGVVGTATGLDGKGVQGVADFGTGVLGTGETGVKGTSAVGPGVLGEGSVGVQGDGQAAEGVMGTSQSTYGVTGEGPLGGVKGTSTGGDGVEGRSQSGSGVIGVSTAGDGVVGNSQTGVAVFGNSGGEAAIKGEGPKGVFGVSSADFGEGVHGNGTGSSTEGVLGTSTHGVGVWGVTGATWGLGTPQSLWVEGSCTGCTIAYVAQNGDAISLQVGDVVSIDGIAPPLKGQQTPVLYVQRATAAGGGFLGVVQARAAVEEVPAYAGDATQAETIQMPGAAPGDVAPGEYLFVVVQGLVQVRADASSSAIQAGDPLGLVSAAGLAQKLDQRAAAPTLGRALEPLAKGAGLIWVLVLGR
ncbi:MAG: hypothetical protein ACE5HA_01175 [Anaerolineae bacterium]